MENEKIIAKKEMTAQEFIESFNMAFGDDSFKYYGFDGILNMIARLNWYDYEDYSKRGIEILAESSSNTASKIHSLLASRGFYD